MICLRFVRMKKFLNRYVIGQVISFEISEMRQLFVICQMRPNYEGESSIIQLWRPAGLRLYHRPFGLSNSLAHFSASSNR